MTALLESVKNIAWQACDAIMDIYQGSIEITDKPDRSPLTQADLAAHQLITRQLSELTPAWPILSEESGAEEIQHRLSWSTFWLVDPLDGTKEFIDRNGEFTVNIALVHKGHPILGVIAAPVLKTMWYGTTGEGAWRQRLGEAVEPIRAATWQIGEKLRVVGSRSHSSDELKHLLEILPPHHLEGVGSSLKFCRIAEGAADCYPRPGSTCEWDTAAAHIILEEAGGTVLQLNTSTMQVEKPLQYNQRSTLVNPDFVALGRGLEKRWNHDGFLKETGSKTP
ncbi:3'(2'),5'-bisphosphate nucleotidase [Kushneria avicenniae]|uniref:3'(2'),5'-bisphosphate nucleotidase CysQ n=1 Tax=Kushneria avicenniae TaxID=402385 RepID=A0A1I1F703_9GAMM|nr:3'(2'),5'-bisphosphate nucleotidase CysQ [Kushneria avicenniae]SFB94736.1 3'(2'),5'-bisphosphate nucleotidase [Kushneria avicenniae]